LGTGDVNLIDNAKGTIMQCPVCDTTLRPIEKYGVEVDICPGCKGVWLDRGELEKIIQLEVAGGPVTRQSVEDGPGERRPQAVPIQYQDERRHHDDDDDDDRYHGQRTDNQGRPLRKKRGSWLGDLLEGFGGD